MVVVVDTTSSLSDLTGVELRSGVAGETVVEMARRMPVLELVREGVCDPPWSRLSTSKDGGTEKPGGTVGVDLPVDWPRPSRPGGIGGVARRESLLKTSWPNVGSAGNSTSTNLSANECHRGRWRRWQADSHCSNVHGPCDLVKLEANGTSKERNASADGNLLKSVHTRREKRKRVLPPAKACTTVHDRIERTLTLSAVRAMAGSSCGALMKSGLQDTGI